MIIDTQGLCAISNDAKFVALAKEGNVLILSKNINKINDHIGTYKIELKITSKEVRIVALFFSKNSYGIWVYIVTQKINESNIFGIEVFERISFNGMIDVDEHKNFLWTSIYNNYCDTSITQEIINIESIFRIFFRQHIEIVNFFSYIGFVKYTTIDKNIYKNIYKILYNPYVEICSV